MSKIWEYLDAMEELVYISDKNSHEIIYMNQRALQTYGFHSLDEAVGKKCRMELSSDGENGFDSTYERLVNTIRKLEEMSYHDQLTGIGNRYAMKEYIDNLQANQSLGIVYCDVTGLKQVNDRDGHAFGDKLITDACCCLKRSFGRYGLFRIGGDEMLVLCMGIDESGLWQGIELLKRELRSKSIHMAVGGLWERDTFGGVDRLIAEAEKRMYNDKAAYYMKFGMDRRHPLENIERWI